MVEHVACNLCGTDDADLVYPSTLPPVSDGQDTERRDGSWLAFRCTHSGYGTHPPIVRCRQCGLVYTDPRPNGSDILETYQAVEDPLYIEEREGRVLTFEHHLKPLERLTGKPAGRPLLDVGAYSGVFVEIAAEHGWDAWGVEPSSWAVEQARSRGLRVVQGALETADLPDGHFDVVTMWDVIEHLTDPREALLQARRLLTPGGLLVIHTIDIESLFARLMGPRWPWLMEMHIYYFSRHTLRAMLERCGFHVLSDAPQGRYLRLGYLMNRVGALAPPLGQPAEWLVTRLGLRSLAVPINLGDLFTAYARKIV
jgi:ubiquinone/menaquinone biosynthesis C-methylase UbiE